MKALVYNGPKDVSVKEVPDAKIEKPTDVVVEITTTNICGSDLHMYEGRTSVEKGKVWGTRIWERSSKSARPSIP
jgi:threonine dehydrogenase-like Zn-dependent dehydrogenase